MNTSVLECFKALSDDKRLAVLMAVLANPGTDLVELTAKLGVSTVWHHLRALVNAGLLIKDKQDSKEAYYYVNKEKLLKLAQYLTSLAERIK